MRIWIPTKDNAVIRIRSKNWIQVRSKYIQVKTGSETLLQAVSCSSS
jgi:hypothetical protein